MSFWEKGEGCVCPWIADSLTGWSGCLGSPHYETTGKMMESKQPIWAPSHQRVGCRGRRTPLLSSFFELVGSGKLSFFNVTWPFKFFSLSYLYAAILRLQPCIRRPQQFVYLCKSNQSWFFLPRLQTRRELCRLSLKVLCHANRLIQLYTLPNLFIFKQRIAQKGKNLQHNLEPAALLLIWRGQFACKDTITCRLNYESVVFFRNAFEKLSCECECAAKGHKYEFFSYGKTDNVRGYNDRSCFPKWLQLRTGLDLGGWVLRSNLNEIYKKKEKEKLNQAAGTSCRITTFVQTCKKQSFEV